MVRSIRVLKKLICAPSFSCAISARFRWIEVRRSIIVINPPVILRSCDLNSPRFLSARRYSNVSPALAMPSGSSCTVIIPSFDAIKILFVHACNAGGQSIIMMSYRSKRGVRSCCNRYSLRSTPARSLTILCKAAEDGMKSNPDDK